MQTYLCQIEKILVLVAALLVALRDKKRSNPKVLCSWISFM